jgi:Protein of unknown function (DUF2510)
MTERQPGWGELTPGWYLDPADGRQQRFWDGSQWTQQVKPVRGGRHGRRFVIGVVAAAVVGLVVFILALDWALTTIDHRRLDRKLDAIVLLADIQLESQEHTGWMCLDVCSTLQRHYSSGLPEEQTHRIFVAELERLGYQCLEGCGRIDAVRSAWGRSARHLPHIDLEVGYGYAELTLQA